MTATQVVMNTLERYGIDEVSIREWETALGLQIPTDDFGRKIYSPHHVKLFRNIKKHVTLGRTLDEIKAILALPPMMESHPRSELSQPEFTPRPLHKSYMTPPSSTPSPMAHHTTSIQPLNYPEMAPILPQSDGLGKLVDRLMSEKDALQKKLTETEKLNSHLYNANNMFHRRVKGLNEKIEALEAKLSVQEAEDVRMKLLDDKSQLQRKLIDSIKQQGELEKTVSDQLDELEALEKSNQALRQQLVDQISKFDPARFCGEWEEYATLQEVPYDNFGIHIEPERQRCFRISSPPSRVFGNTAIITTHYEYESNTLWRRTETLTLVYIQDDHLVGELESEYYLDNVPISKAIYTVRCQPLAIHTT